MLNADALCELHCRPLEKKFLLPLKFSPKVRDGTPCTEDSRDLCIGGICYVRIWKSITLIIIIIIITCIYNAPFPKDKKRRYEQYSNNLSIIKHHGNRSSLSEMLNEFRLVAFLICTGNREGSIPNTFLGNRNNKIDTACGASSHHVTRWSFDNLAVLDVLGREPIQWLIYIQQCFIHL